ESGEHGLGSRDPSVEEALDGRLTTCRQPHALDAPIRLVLAPGDETPLHQRLDCPACGRKRYSEVPGDLLDREVSGLLAFRRLRELIQVGKELELGQREVELVDLTQEIAVAGVGEVAHEARKAAGENAGLGREPLLGR